MNNNQSFTEIVSRMKNVIDAPTDDWFELAKIADLDHLTCFAGKDLSNFSPIDRKLSGANFSKTNFSNSDLSKTDLSNANLSYANLSNTNLKNANLSNANLTHANLSNADLTNADLSGADLTNTILHNAKIENAIFKNNIGLWVGVPFSVSPQIEELNNTEIRLPPGMSIEYWIAEFLITQNQMTSHDNQQPQKMDSPKSYIEIYNPSNESNLFKFEAIFNSEAPINCIPESIISSLGALTYSNIKLRDNLGKILSLKTYYVNIKINGTDIENVEVVAIPKEYAVINQHILNQYQRNSCSKNKAS
ncbi:pentapeptide repeat-containing protein [Aphanothece sacrum]|uniref:Pentapeptide repeat protein n=1 Tax=Aphanothece sacrum FPU1 TaxID=1920663 RepID=A0A401IGH5_APHSA|nr:pentapeptide repeat-containing protein [Aphanothece sacrum]GBF80321.1 pentapeptide repeat protein [Aphanothece sacrum FPU1]GBF83728.1 pentapeptide repeat protein [Aphanothece sacrum FPU3]